MEQKETGRVEAAGEGLANNQPARLTPIVSAKQLESQLVTSTATQVTKMVRWPPLKSAQEAAPVIGISEDRLTELADAGFAPHWRIDGGPPQFLLNDLKEWAKGHLLVRFDGKTLPSKLTIVFEGARADPHS